MGGGTGNGDVYDSKVIKPGDWASELAFKVNIGSYHNNRAIEMVLDPATDWRKEAGYVPKPHICLAMAERVDTPEGLRPLMWETQSTDGAGHKPNVIAAVGTRTAFRMAGPEPIIMNDHDIIRRGGFPAIMTNFMDVKSIIPENEPLLEAFWEGYGEALKEAGLINVTGETAVVRYSVTAFCQKKGMSGQLLMNLAGNCTGFHHAEKYISGKNIQPDMPIVGFWEPSLRCNGFTHAIDVGTAIFGPDFDGQEAREYYQALSLRSTSYSKALLRAHGWNNNGTISPALVDMRGIYHITGGGIWNKLKLPAGIGAFLNEMRNPNDTLLWVQKLSQKIPRLSLSDWQCHRTFHGGYGVMVVCATMKDAETLVLNAQKDGKIAHIIGKTTESRKNEIVIHSRFIEGKSLSSLRPE